MLDWTARDAKLCPRRSLHLGNSRGDDLTWLEEWHPRAPCYALRVGG